MINTSKGTNNSRNKGRGRGVGREQIIVSSITSPAVQSMSPETLQYTQSNITMCDICCEKLTKTL